MRLISIIITIALFSSIAYAQVTPTIPESIQCGELAPNISVSGYALNVSYPDQADFQFRYDYCLFEAWMTDDPELNCYDTFDFFVDWDNISIDPCNGIMLPLQTGSDYDCFILNTQTGTARLIINGHEFVYSRATKYCKRI
jgi:hypothetical protein